MITVSVKLYGLRVSIRGGIPDLIENQHDDSGGHYDNAFMIPDLIKNQHDDVGSHSDATIFNNFPISNIRIFNSALALKTELSARTIRSS